MPHPLISISHLPLNRGIRQTIAAAVTIWTKSSQKRRSRTAGADRYAGCGYFRAGLTVPDLGMLEQAGIPGLSDIDIDGAPPFVRRTFQLTPDQRPPLAASLISANDLISRLPETLCLKP
ncbi:MAG: hypothetical protein R2875_16580 [Desulfobacterales bacterium]